MPVSFVDVIFYGVFAFSTFGHICWLILLFFIWFSLRIFLGGQLLIFFGPPLGVEEVEDVFDL